MFISSWCISTTSDFIRDWNKVSNTYHKKIWVQVGDLKGSLHQQWVGLESELVFGTRAIYLRAPVNNPLLKRTLTLSAKAETGCGGKSHTYEKNCLWKNKTSCERV